MSDQRVTLELRLDPERKQYADLTGIYVRARDADGSWDSFDIAELDADSLIAWLRSRGGENPWAENTVGMLLRHKEPLA